MSCVYDEQSINKIASLISDFRPVRILSNDAEDSIQTGNTNAVRSDTPQYIFKTLLYAYYIGITIRQDLDLDVIPMCKEGSVDRHFREYIIQLIIQ